MERTHFQDPCPIAQWANVFGDWWVPMLLREAMYGARTFNEFHENLKISRNSLTRRLNRLVELEIFKKIPYSKRKSRYELSARGRDALNVLAAATGWSNAWVFAKGASPIELRDATTGEMVQPLVVDRATGNPIDFNNLVLAPGPGFPAARSVRQWRFGETGKVRVSV